MPAAAHQLSLEPVAVHEPFGEAEPDTGTASITFDALPQQRTRGSDFQRPAWLSPEIVAFVVGALDFGLVLAAAAAAFAAYSEVMDQTVAWPGRHVLTSLLAATLFAGVFAVSPSIDMLPLTAGASASGRTMGSGDVAPTSTETLPK